MTIQGWGEIALTLGLAALLGWPIGVYMSRVWNGERTWLDPVLKPVEVFTKATSSSRHISQTWTICASLSRQVSNITFNGIAAQTSRTAAISAFTSSSRPLFNQPTLITISISCAPAAIAAATQTRTSPGDRGGGRDGASAACGAHGAD